MRAAEQVGRLVLAAFVLSYSPAHAARPADRLPAEVRQAFADAGVPLSHVALLARPVGAGRDRIAWRADVPMNPASTMKLLTTFAGLELLGPQHSWKTSVLRQGELIDGVLHGSLVLRGGGDPKLTLERFWLLLRELRLRGLRRIEGDVCLDRGAWLPPAPEAAFGATPFRPYNVAPDPLLVNFATLRFRLLPKADGVELLVDPPLPELKLVNRLEADPQPCGDWRNGLQVDVAGPVVTFAGKYRSACGERDYYLSPLPAPDYVAALLRLQWRELGGELGGQVRFAPTPDDAGLWFEQASPPLAEVIRDINKFSNNAQARLLYLSLGRANNNGGDRLPAAETALRQWLAQRRLSLPGLVLENGSGLSRNERITARGLADLLDLAQRSPLGAELESSLPIVAVDGTMKQRLQQQAGAGRAHIKTGSLDGVRSVAGYVHRDDGKWIVVGLVNHPLAANAVAALDAWIAWVAGLPTPGGACCGQPAPAGDAPKPPG